MKAKAKVVESWRQVDGGVRYLVAVSNRRGTVEVTIDADDRGELSGFVRGPGTRPDEDALLDAAFRAVGARRSARG